MADQKLTLSIETKADTAGVTTAVTAVQSMDAAMQKLETSAPEVAEALKKVQAATEQLGDKAEAGGKKVDELDKHQKKASTGHRDSGRAVLEASRALEDLQYGIGGVLNNLPGLVQMLGMGAGLAGVISIVAVGLTQLVKHLDLTGPALDVLGEAAGRAAVKSGESAIATDKHREAMDQAKESAHDITAAIEAEEKALQNQLDALKQNATETAALAKQKKELLEAERDLALAKNAAGEGDEITKLKRKHEINNDYSAAAQKLEAETLNNMKARAAEEAELHDRASVRASKQAAAAEEAQKKLEANAAKKAQGEGEVGRGKNQLGGLLESLGSLSDPDRAPLTAKKMLAGIEEKGDAQTQAKTLLANLEQFSADLTTGKFAGTASTGDFAEASGAGLERNKARIEGILLRLQSGAAKAKASEASQPQLEADAKAYGEPDSYRKQAEAEAKAAAAARSKAAEAAATMAHESKLAPLKLETEGFNQSEELRRAGENQRREEERKREEEERKREQAEKGQGRTSKQVDSAMTKARQLARDLPAGSGAQKSLSNAEDMDALLEVVEMLFKSQTSTNVELGKGVRKEIENLRNQVRNMRRNDKA